MPKVVYNTRRYGQFGLSHLGRHYYLSGCDGFTGEYDEDDIRVDTLDRHDPMLVKCVEDLRQEAYGMEAILAFREVQDLYRIEVDRDGVEKVITPEDALVWSSARGQAHVRLNLENGLAAGLKELPCGDKETIRLLVEECEYRGDTLDQCARERDEARERVLDAALIHVERVRERDEERARALDAALIHAELKRERDEARAQLAAIGTGAPCDGHRHCCANRRKLADELLRVRTERDNAQLTFESCNRARRLAEEECDALKTSLHNCHLCRHL